MSPKVLISFVHFSMFCQELKEKKKPDQIKCKRDVWRPFKEVAPLRMVFPRVILFHSWKYCKENSESEQGSVVLCLFTDLTNVHWRCRCMGDIMKQLRQKLLPSTELILYSRKTDNRKEVLEDFPGDPVVKNPLSNVVDMGLIPGWGAKIPHASGPHALQPMCHN